MGADAFSLQGVAFGVELVAEVSGAWPKTSAILVVTSSTTLAPFALLSATGVALLAPKVNADGPGSLYIVLSNVKADGVVDSDVLKLKWADG